MKDREADLAEIDRQWRLLYEHLAADPDTPPGELLDSALRSVNAETRVRAETLLNLLCKVTIGRAAARMIN